MESTESIKNRLGPHTKFSEKSNCTTNRSDKNIGAKTVVGLGIINTSFVSILNKSASIWNAPLRPIKVGPIRRWANAKTLRSNRTVNNVNRITISEEINEISCKVLN